MPGHALLSCSRRARWSVEHTQSLAVFASAPAVALPPSAIGKLAYLLQAAGCKLQVYKSCKIHFRKKPKPQYRKQRSRYTLQLVSEFLWVWDRANIRVCAQASDSTCRTTGFVPASYSLVPINGNISPVGDPTEMSYVAQRFGAEGPLLARLFHTQQHD